MCKINVVGLLGEKNLSGLPKDILCYFILGEKIIQKDSFG